ncbi:hypothetical protein HRI_000424300 [Hibiscus trionum]|uniref:Uncharacterized protein n=1 Tax=Hibiscus trionum TaxID=183268 RepID=A0A9W7LLE3_HIBTR|nr:hypothetical protein HRI_000424300 [Hibiscus trionum]
MDRTKMRMQNHEATLKSLETQVGQFAQILNSRPMGGFPSDTEKETKPKEQIGSTMSEPTSSEKSDHAAAIELGKDTEKNQKVVEQPYEMPHIKFSCNERIEDIRLPPPFPQRLKR